jgi:stearoyl-CoA desaturase (delta-9 desaturase)
MPAALQQRPRRQVKGLRHFTPDRIRRQKVVMLIVTLGPLAGLALAIAMLWGNGFAASDAVAFVTMYVVSILGVTVGYHRMLTHAGFDAKPWVRNSWAALGSLAVEGAPLNWVADHRRHHAHSDEEGDPHSPHLHGDESTWGMLKGLWHAHVGWMLNRTDDSDPARWAPDMLKLRGIVVISRWWPAFAVLSIVVIPALIGYAISGTLMGAFTGFLWGGPVRLMVGHHITWSTNSICHVFGSRPFDSGDRSTNNWMLAILSMGESWHNNHHAFPSSAVHGLRWWQVDITAMVIRTMEKLRLVSNVKTPSAGAPERKRISRDERRRRRVAA